MIESNDKLEDQYFDENFINLVNSVENQNFSNLFEVYLDNYEFMFNQDTLNKLTKASSLVFGFDNDNYKIMRQLKALINRCIFFKANKKIKTDLVELGFSQEKVDIVIEMIQTYLDKFTEINKKSDKRNLVLQDFEIITKMPTFQTNNNLIDQLTQEPNIDIRKQKIVINLDINNKRSNTNENKIVEMDKKQLISFYEELEKIQEKLDKLY